MHSGRKSKAKLKFPIHPNYFRIHDQSPRFSDNGFFLVVCHCFSYQLYFAWSKTLCNPFITMSAKSTGRSTFLLTPRMKPGAPPWQLNVLPRDHLAYYKAETGDKNKLFSSRKLMKVFKRCFQLIVGGSFVIIYIFNRTK